MHLSYFADINYEYVGYAMPLFGQGLGVGLTWLNVAPFNSTLDPSAIQGSASDYSLTAAYALPLGPRLSIGANAKTFISNLVSNSAMGAAVDLGALFEPFGKSLALAVVAQNLGMQSSFEKSSDPLPISLRFGGAWRHFNSSADNDFNFLMDVNKSIDNRFKFNFGVEWWALSAFALRGGYKFSEGGQDFAYDDTTALANFTAGAGFKLGAADLDYAFVPLGELGFTHRISASWKFGYTPAKVEKEAILQAAPKVATLGDGQGTGVAFNMDSKKALGNVPVREWKVEVRDADGRLVKTLSGTGVMPKNLAWDMKDAGGNAVNREQSYKFNVLLRDVNGRSVSTDGFIAKEIRPREMMSSAPKFDAKVGALVFQPKAALSVGVKEWKLNIRGKDGTILKTLTGTGAIPKNLSWKPTEMSSSGGLVNLAASKQVSAIQYDLEFKDASGQSRVVSDQVRFAMGKAEEKTYKMPVPVKEFKVNRGREVLVASIPSLTSASLGAAKSSPFVMPVPPAGGVKRWKFEVVDPKGRLVKTFKGDSDLPETIFWDGRDEGGASVADAERSSFSFWVVDKNEKEIKTEERRTVRNPFTISSAQGKIRKITGLWFRFLDTDIQEAILEKLREIAQILRKYANVQVTIQGHAWNEGTPEEILRLSQERADSVLRFLIEEEGINPRNVSSIGYGDTMPLVAGSSEEADEKNRRVEVVIISK